MPLAASDSQERRRHNEATSHPDRRNSATSPKGLASAWSTVAGIGVMKIVVIRFHKREGGKTSCKRVLIASHARGIDALGRSAAVLKKLGRSARIDDDLQRARHVAALVMETFPHNVAEADKVDRHARCISVEISTRARAPPMPMIRFIEAEEKNKRPRNNPVARRRHGGFFRARGVAPARWQQFDFTVGDRSPRLCE
jgi:hypothetical protein